MAQKAGAWAPCVGAFLYDELACAVRRGGIARPVCEEEAAGNLPHKRKGAALFAALHRLFVLLLG